MNVNYFKVTIVTITLLVLAAWSYGAANYILDQGYFFNNSENLFEEYFQ